MILYYSYRALLTYFLCSITTTAYPASTPKMLPSIAMVTISTPNRQPFAQYTLESFKKYATQWHYDLRIFDTQLEPARAIEWSKIKAVQQVLNENIYDWVAWFDDDIFITNPTISLESFIQRAGNDCHFIIDRDHIVKPEDFMTKNLITYYINTGLFIVKNSPWTKEFLRDVWDIGFVRHQTKRPGFEQAAVGELLLTSEKYKRATQIHTLPGKALQSYLFLLHKNPTSMLQWLWEVGDFTAHMAGQPEWVRVLCSEQLAKDSFAYPTVSGKHRRKFTFNPNERHQKNSHIPSVVMIGDLQQSNTILALKKYADDWNYKLNWISKEPESSTHAPQIEKIKQALNVLQQTTIRWVACIDGEVTIDQDISLETITQKYGTTSNIIIIPSKSSNGRGTSTTRSIVLFHNTPAIHSFLESIIQHQPLALTLVNTLQQSNGFNSMHVACITN